MATYITCTAAACDVRVRCSSYNIHILIIAYGRWSDVGNIFVYIICIYWPSSFLEERGIPWSDDIIYLDANRSILSLGYDFHHAFSALCAILSDTKVWVVTLFAIK